MSVCDSADIVSLAQPRSEISCPPQGRGCNCRNYRVVFRLFKPSVVPKFCILLTTRTHTYCMDVVDSHQLRNFFPRQFKLLLLSSSSAFADPRLPRAYSYVY